MCGIASFCVYAASETRTATLLLRFTAAAEDGCNDSNWNVALRMDRSFAAEWQAEELGARPLILPRRHFVYPAAVDEVERGALELMVQPAAAEGFLATCALGFASPAVPTGVWSCPDPAMLCAVAGGYAYLIDTRSPERWEQVGYRPVTEVRPLPEVGLLVFASFHSIEAWGAEGRRWQTGRLSWEGVRLGASTADELRGWGWEMRTDTELEFVVNLRTGEHQGGPSFTG